jgi:exodeoxyribonuclease III
LQETKCTDDQFPVLALRAVGYRSAYHGEKSYNGVAILSKSEPRDVRSALCDEVIDPQARVIAATIETVRVFSVYAPNGQAVGSPAYEYKLKWYARLRDCLFKEETAELAVCGDFNVAPEDVDVHNPDLWRVVGELPARTTARTTATTMTAPAPAATSGQTGVPRRTRAGTGGGGTANARVLPAAVSNASRRAATNSAHAA